MKYSEKESLYRLASYCSRSERSTFDIRKKLELWNIDNETSERIIKYLIKEDFLNEERYCRSFIKDKLNLNKWGKTKIIFELKKKQVSTSIINSCFEEIDNQDFEKQLYKILINKAKQTKSINHYEKRTKLTRFALSRGYSYEEIKKCLSEITKDNDYDDLEYFP